MIQTRSQTRQSMTAGRFLGGWLLLLLGAVINGLLRDLTYGRYLTELQAHQVSTCTAVLLFAALIAGLGRRWGPVAHQTAWWVGAGWLLLTLLFESLFFHFVAGNSIQQLWANYDVSAGRLWPLLLLWVLVAPRCLWR